MRSGRAVRLPPDPSEPGYADEGAALDEAMAVLQILNAAGKHTLKSIDRHVALTFRYDAIRERRKREQGE
jgi:hypothetical protein